MAATVESAFVLIDRASGPISRIRRELRETRLEAERTGRALDDMSGPRVARQLDTTAREQRTLGRETGKTSTETDRAARSMQTLERRAAGLGRETKKTRIEWSALGKVLNLLKWPALIAGVGGLTQAIGGLAAGTIALIPRLLDLAGTGAGVATTMIGVGAAMGVVKLATSDLTKAYGGNKNALKSLTPEGRAFLQMLRDMHPEVKRLRQEAQRGLFPGLGDLLGSLRSQAPALRQIVRQTAGDLGNLARFGSRQISAPGFMQDLAELSDQSGRSLGSAARSGFYFAHAIEEVLIAGAPFTDWLGKSVERLARLTEQEAHAARESGRLGEFYDRTKESLTTMVDVGRHAFGGLMGLMRAARGEGDSLWESIDRGATRWDKWSNSVRGQDSMRRWFADMRPVLHETVGLAGDLAKMVADLSRGPEGATMLHSIREEIPAIADGMRSLTANLGPAVVDALGNVVTLFADASGSAGPLTLLAHSVGLLAHDLDLLVNALGPAGPALATFLGSLALLKRMNVIGTGGAIGALALGGRGGGGGGAGGVGAGTALAGGAAAGGLGGMLARSKARYRLASRGGFMVGPAGEAEAVAAGGMLGGASAVGRSALGAAARFMAPVAVFSGALGALGAQPTQGGAAGLGQRAVAFGDSASFGLTSALRNATGIGKNYGWSDAQFDAAGFKGVGGSIWGALNAHGGQNPNRKEAAQQVEYLTRMQKMYENETTAGGRRIYAAINRELDLRKQLLHTMRLQRDEESVKHGTHLATDAQHAFAIRAKDKGPVEAMKTTVDAVLREQGHMRPKGAKQLDDTMLVWAQQMAKNNPKLQGEVDRLTDGIKRSFSRMGKHVSIVNGQVLVGSKVEWSGIRQALTTQTEKAREEVSADFTAIQRQAVGSLTAMGFSPSAARQLVSQIEQGGTSRGGAQAKIRAVSQHGVDPDLALKPTGDGPGAPASAFASKSAGSPALMGANADLGPYASLGASMGLHISSGLRPGAKTLSGNTSYHSSGNAIDMAGAPDAMHRFAQAMANRYGSGLEELITPWPELNIKNGRPFRYSPDIEAQHSGSNAHVHVADVDPSGAGGLSFPFSPDTAGPGMMNVSLSGKPSKIGGIPGILSGRASDIFAAGLQEKLNAALSGGAAMPGGGKASAGGQYDKAELATLWSSANPGVGNPNLMAAIALAESAGNPRAHNPSGASGLWQILGLPFKGNPYDPYTNARMAGSKLRSQGLGAWEVYTKGTYRQYMGDGTGMWRRPAVQAGGLPVLARTPGGGPSASGPLFTISPGAVQITAGGRTSARALERIVERKLQQFANEVHAELVGGREESEEAVL